MFLKSLTLLCAFTCCLTLIPREKLSSDTNGENFVLVGASSPSQKIKFEDDKKIRSAYYFPMMAVNPSQHGSDYHHHHSHGSPNSLLNLNLGLLEPFMLVTFLLFVVNLIEKAKILHIARKDKLDEGNYNYYNKNPDNFYYITKRNSTI